MPARFCLVDEGGRRRRRSLVGVLVAGWMEERVVIQCGVEGVCCCHCSLCGRGSVMCCALGAVVPVMKWPTASGGAPTARTET